jgi:uroporphyrinogen decarboxylase
MLHSDGLITTLLPDFIAIGIDVVHPLEPVPALDQAAIKAAYGDRLAFLGGIDISHAMPGTIADVAAEVKRCLAALAPGAAISWPPPTTCKPTCRRKT